LPFSPTLINWPWIARCCQGWATPLIGGIAVHGVLGWVDRSIGYTPVFIRLRNLAVDGAGLYSVFHWSLGARIRDFNILTTAQKAVCNHDAKIAASTACVIMKRLKPRSEDPNQSKRPGMDRLDARETERRLFKQYESLAQIINWLLEPWHAHPIATPRAAESHFAGGRVAVFSKNRRHQHGGIRAAWPGKIICRARWTTRELGPEEHKAADVGGLLQLYNYTTSVRRGVSENIEIPASWQGKRVTLFWSAAGV